jgi:hypothetical protein
MQNALPKQAIQPYQYKTEPYEHQRVCFERSRDMEGFGILFEMGAGKSKVVVDTSAYLHSHGKIEAVLLIAPNGVHRKWLQEDFPFSFPEWAQYKGAVWQAGNKDAMKDCEDLFKPGSHLRVLCMNVEGFSGKSGIEMAKRFLDTFDCMMVIDESSRIKNPDAIRTKNILKLGFKAKYRRILTGTYISNSPFDAYSQFMFLDDTIFGQSFYAFKAQYAEIMDKNSPMVQAIQRKSGSRFAPMMIAKDRDGKPMYKNLPQLKALISPISMRVTKEQCLSLPPKIYEKRHFSMEKDQQRIYDQLRDKMKSELLDATLTILHKMTLMLRLQQVSSGYMPNDDGKLIQIFDDPKDNPRIKTLVDSLEDIEGSVIIWCRFVEEIRQLKEILGNDAVCYYGGVSQEGRLENLNLFRSGEKRFFIGNVATGGIGLNLTQATTVIYYSNTFSYEDRKQSEDRAHRIGQTADKVLYLDLQAESTIDEKIIKALMMKENLATFMNDLKNCSI